MKRKLAFLLAGCLILSPISAGTVSNQVLAAETESSADEAPSGFSASAVVKDGDDTVLDTEQEYNMDQDESYQITIRFDQDPASTLPPPVFTSDAPDIVSVSDDGELTALSPGTAHIKIEFPDISPQISLLYTICVSAPEAAESESDPEESVEADAQEPEDTSEEAVEVSEGAEEISEENAEANETSEETADIADTSEQTAETSEEAAEITESSEETADVAETSEQAAEIPEEAAAIADTSEQAAEIPEAAADIADTSEQAAEIPEEAAEASTGATEETAAAVEPDEAQENAGDAAEAGEIIEEAGPAEETAAIESSKAEVSEETAGEALAQAKAEQPENVKADPSKVKAAAATAKTESPTVTGWVKSGSSWIYILKDGKRATGILKLGSSAFFLNSSGIMRTGWIQDGSKFYYADPNNEGRLKTGWAKINGYTFYFDPSSYARKTGIQRIGGKLYVFSPLGRRRTGPRWVTAPQGRCYVKSDNTLQQGWLRYGGNRYYFRESGVMRLGWYKPDGKIYYFCGKGFQVTGFKKILGYKYYLKTDGSITKGWKKISGKWYYFDSNCRMKTGWLKLGTRKYYLDTNGVMVTGYKTIGGVSYYFNSEGVLSPKPNSYRYSNTQEFINCIAPLIQKYAPRYNVKVISPIIAQAILESASGESSLGKKYHNYFGLKCGTLWKGKSVNLLTGEEYTPGTYTTIAADFRVFDNMEEGVKGYFEFLFRNRTRYNNLIGETDPYRYLQKIKDDGYATSSKYVQNVYAVIQRYNLTRFDD